MSRLLIVDDERSLREVLQVVFKKEGHTVSVAGSYEEFLRGGCGRLRVPSHQTNMGILVEIKVPTKKERLNCS